MLKTLKSFIPDRIKVCLKAFLRKKRFASKNRLNREHLSHIYLKGGGIEIGALHNPLPVSKKAHVKYVDRYSVAGLKQHYPELSQYRLVDVDIIDNGEQLATIPASSQDFVIANHFVEHCQNPIFTLSNMYRVLKKEGILFIALPDKRYTFDQDRPVTPFEHLLKDYHEGAEHSKRQHFEEWTILVDKVTDPKEAEKYVEKMLKIDYSIHFHVWTQTEMLEIFVNLKKQFHLKFDVEACLKNEHEFILILRKME